MIIKWSSVYCKSFVECDSVFWKTGTAGRAKSKPQQHRTDKTEIVFSVRDCLFFSLFQIVISLEHWIIRSH